LIEEKRPCRNPKQGRQPGFPAAPAPQRRLSQPETSAMRIAGLGMVGALLRRRRASIA
jgi:hypothetical protein